MKKTKSIILLSIITLGVVVFAGVCWHSIEEIHYLKSFFPRQFGLQDAYYASAIELIKVIIIGLPIALVIAVSLCILRQINKEQ